MRLFGVITLFLINSLFSQNLIDNNGLKQGKWKKFYENSQNIQFEGEFLNDKPIGIFTYYNPDGKISARMAHFTDSTSRIEIYHEDGSLMTDGIYLNKMKDSTWLNYTRNGNLSSLESYKNDLLNGISITFYISDEFESDRVFRKSNYLMGKLDGDYFEFFPSAKMKIKGQYQKGIPIGQWSEYYNTGKIYKTYKYKEGKIHGWLYMYRDDGKIASKSLFKSGVLMRGKELEEYLNYCQKNNLNPDF